MMTETMQLFKSTFVFTCAEFCINLQISCFVKIWLLSLFIWAVYGMAEGAQAFLPGVTEF